MLWRPYGSCAAGSWLAMVLTYTCCLGLTYGVIRATRKSWDYVVSSSVLHLLLCIISESPGAKLGGSE